MLYLDKSLLVGEGAHRKCYRHPIDQKKCIKISKLSFSNIPTLENKYYDKLEKTQISWRHLSRRFEEVNTNFGTGYVFELVRDYDENTSLPISHYLNAQNSTNISLDVVNSALLELKHFLYDNNIVVRNLRPYNMLYRRINKQEGSIVIIDNIGHHNNRVHISDYIAYFSKIDISHKWHEFEMKYVNRS